MINFDEVTDRRGTNSSKWDVLENELPLSTADMDFKAAPEIIEALSKRVKHGIFGYSDVSEEWQRSLISWWKRRHHFEIKKEWLMFCTGVIPAISSSVRKITTPAEKIVVLTPVYNIFFNSILNNGRVALECPLIEKDGDYEIDFEDLEKKLADPQTTMMILCNPHNPIGKIWSREELRRIGELCERYHVVVLSDEIHCDLTDPHEEYIPYGTVSESCLQNSIICVAPSKTFNLAGLQSAAIIVANEGLRNRINRAINTDEVAEPNAFAMDATVAAFDCSEYWLDELRAYIFENKQRVREYIRREIKGLKVLDSKATYLLWIDCRELDIDSDTLAKYLREKTGLILSSGKIYRGDGFHYLRMNTAYPRSMIDDALKRLKTGIEMLEKETEEIK